ncbi:MAG: ThiF family adenylyltransferase [Candidatus Omnitrophica bacterium]|nr:ThiF family adenylyltransferase [Candidatus Omnitrophota bacterium]
METTAFYSEMIDRNLGVISREEQERLRNTCIAVAGCGGMGGLSASQLVRLGVGHVKIADFDNFVVHNLSRQHGSTTCNVGQNKAGVLAKEFKEINPELRLDVYKDGVTPQNVSEFVEGASVIIDGTDYTRMQSMVLMYRKACERNICIVNPNAIGFGVNVFVFGPKTLSLEEYMGISSADGARPALEKMLPYVPAYGDPLVIQKALAGEINIPNIIMPQHLGTSIAVSEAILMVLGRVSEPAGPEPRIFILDLLERKFEVKN